MKALILLVSLFLGNAYACSCAEWGTAAEILKEVDVAFVGTYVKGVIIPTDAQEANRKTTFKVNRAFKPRPMRTNKSIVRSTRGDGANCGTYFGRGGRYLILGYKDASGNIYTDDCSTRVVRNTPEMIALLLEFEAASK